MKLRFDGMRVVAFVASVALIVPAVILGVRASRRPVDSTSVADWLGTSQGQALPSESSSPDSLHVRDLSAILKRNIFDSQTGSLGKPVHSEEIGSIATTAVIDPPPPPPARHGPLVCATQAKITGAIDSEDGRVGMVYLSPGAGQHSLELRVGDLFDNRVVQSIAWDVQHGAIVTFAGDATTEGCVISQFGNPGASSTAPSTVLPTVLPTVIPPVPSLRPRPRF